MPECRPEILNASPSSSALVERNYITKLRALGRPCRRRQTPSRCVTSRTRRDDSYWSGTIGFDCNSLNDTGAFCIQTYSGDIANLTTDANLLEGGNYQLFSALALTTGTAA
jgi:hypothetical protein